MLNVAFALRSDRTMKALSEQLHSRRSDRQRNPGGGGKYRLDRVETKLFFILLYVKCYPTFDVAGVLY